MYFKHVEIENVGPLSNLDISFGFNEDGSPKPLLIVGENGSGKSILLSHLVNVLVVLKQEFYDNVEVEKGKVYKYRSPSYIQAGAHYSRSVVSTTSDIKVSEWQLVTDRESFEKSLNYTPARSDWNRIPADQASYFFTNMEEKRKEVGVLVKKQCCQYFPVNRFEEPAWLNYDNLTIKAKYTDFKRVTGISNRHIISISPLRENQNWLLDLIFDRQAFEMKLHDIQLDGNFHFKHFIGFEGKSTTIYNATLEILKVILRAKHENIRFGVGGRENRQISVMKDERVWVPNIFQLSTGETQLLNLFLSIVRDYDLSEGVFQNLSDIKGIVIVDEVDAHLHTAYQMEVLPELISLFPNVQFVITTHSPLFLMGLENRVGSKSFDIINLPSGVKTSANDYSEFVEGYNAFRATETFKKDIQGELTRLSKPIVFVEGDYDIRYIRRAAQLLGKEGVLNRIELRDAVGFGGLDKIWRGYDNHVSEVLPNKLVLLYDCDTKRPISQNGKVYKRVVPSISENPIAVGIENLFPVETIARVEVDKPQFIDIQPRTVFRQRGVEMISPEKRSINKDEKGNLCNWLCEHGEQQDFENFASLFAIVEEVIGCD